MNIEITRAGLLPALSIVSGVVEKRQTLPILGNLLLSASDASLAIRGTDLELEIATRTPAEVHDSGSVTVPARKFLDICRTLPEGAMIRIRKEAERVLVSSGRSRFSLSTLPADDFPSMETGELDLSLDLDASVLKRLFEKTAFAMAQQDVRYYLNGVLLELQAASLVSVATDGHRLAKMSGALAAAVDTGESSRQAIVPAKSVIELKRLLPTDDALVRLEMGARTIRVSFGETAIVSKLVDGKYPEYDRVIPKDLPHVALLAKDVLKGALQRTAILSNEKYKGVRVSFNDGVLGLLSHNPEHEQAEDEVEMEYQGEPVVVGFNVGYIMDVINAVETSRIEVRLRDADGSSIWRGEGTEDEIFVIMPMRL
ncbi:DNA polymerase III subunit beta [Thiohalocapsa marina]|uniref:Beta sliding clamp n=1 Tax=Thiohalocapsa marina TaxID=424902 RepID=A0A5M8FTW0_9GAMM|nr:DNA polymerase III subunit beta [Thiohalocapsa marina]KAA6187251.1 DNA polymerase III subunit beta [Thiohalocapsa marina]